MIRRRFLTVIAGVIAAAVAPFSKAKDFTYRVFFDKDVTLENDESWTTMVFADTGEPVGDGSGRDWANACTNPFEKAAEKHNGTGRNIFARGQEPAAEWERRNQKQR